MVNSVSCGGLEIAPQFHYANVNLPVSTIATATLDDLERIRDWFGRRGAEFAGYELTLTRRLAQAAFAGTFAKHSDIGNRVHQPWSTSPRDRFKQDRLRPALANAVAWTIVPEVDNPRTFEAVERINHQLGGIVFCGYPNVHDRSGKLMQFGKYARFSEAQITPDAVTAAGAADNYRNLHDLFQQTGIVAAAFDPHHADGLYKDVVGEMRANSTLVGSLHIPLGRSPDSAALLEAVLRGPDAIIHTKVGQMLAAAYKLACEQRGHVYLSRERLEETGATYDAIIQRYTRPDGTIDRTAAEAEILSNPTLVTSAKESEAAQEYLGDPVRGSTVPIVIEWPYPAFQIRTLQGLRIPNQMTYASMLRDILGSLDEFFRRRTVITPTS